MAFTSSALGLKTAPMDEPDDLKDDDDDDNDEDGDKKEKGEPTEGDQGGIL